MYTTIFALLVLGVPGCDDSSPDAAFGSTTRIDENLDSTFVKEKFATATIKLTDHSLRLRIAAETFTVSPDGRLVFSDCLIVSRGATFYTKTAVFTLERPYRSFEDLGSGFISVELANGVTVRLRK